MAQYAVVEGSLVVNIIEWDGITEYNPGPDLSLVPLVEPGRIGATWDGMEFIAPAQSTDQTNLGS